MNASKNLAESLNAYLESSKRDDNLSLEVRLRLISPSFINYFSNYVAMTCDDRHKIIKNKLIRMEKKMIGFDSELETKINKIVKDKIIFIFIATSCIAAIVGIAIQALYTLLK